MLRPKIPPGGGKWRNARREKREPLTNKEKLSLFDLQIGKIRERSAELRKSYFASDPSMKSKLVGFVSRAIPSKAREYVEKLNSGEAFNISFGPHEFTVVPDGFLSASERKSLQGLLRESIHPSRRVLAFSDFKKWAFENISLEGFGNDVDFLG